VSLLHQRSVSRLLPNRAIDLDALVEALRPLALLNSKTADDDSRDIPGGVIPDAD